MADNADIATDYMQRVTEVTLARRVQYQGISATHCEDCEEEIPQRRRELIPGVTRCVHCQTVAERR